MDNLAQRIADLADNDSKHNRLAVGITEWLAMRDDVTDVQVVEDEVTTTTLGFIYDGRGYSLVVNETP